MGSDNGSASTASKKWCDENRQRPRRIWTPAARRATIWPVRASVVCIAVLLTASACGRLDYEPFARDGGTPPDARIEGRDAGSSVDAALDASTPRDTSVPLDAACAAGEVQIVDGCAPRLRLTVTATVGARTSFLDTEINGAAVLHAVVTSPPGDDRSPDVLLATMAAASETTTGPASLRLRVRHEESTALSMYLVAYRFLRDGTRETLVWGMIATSEPLFTTRTIGASAGDVETAVYIPDEVRVDPATPRPAVLFLHGWGGATTLANATEVARDSGLIQRMIAEPALYRDFPFIVVTPHCIEARHGGCFGWTNHSLPIAALDDVASTYAIDERRTYITGLSTGGEGTFTVASAYPTRFAAAVPTASTYSTRTPVCMMLGVPVWAFHGDADTLQPPSNSQMYVNQIAGGCGALPPIAPTLTLVGCRGGTTNHCGWEEAYDGDHGGSADGFTSVFEWMLAHTR